MRTFTRLAACLCLVLGLAGCRYYRLTDAEGATYYTNDWWRVRGAPARIEAKDETTGLLLEIFPIEVERITREEFKRETEAIEAAEGAGSEND